MSSEPGSIRGSARLLASATAAYCAANLAWWVQPLAIEQLVGSAGLTTSAAGLILSAEMTLLALTAILLAKVLAEVRLLAVGAIGMLIVIVASFLSLEASSYEALLALRGLAGIGEGAVLMMANTAVVHFPDPDKTFGRMTTVNVIAGAVAVFLLPFVATTGKTPGAFIALAVAMCLLAPLVIMLPASLRLRRPDEAARSEADRSGAQTHAWFRIMLLCAATFVVGVASGVMWSFYALIGEQAGLTPVGVNNAIGISILTAIAGAALAALMGSSFGRLIPVTIGIIALTAAIAALSFHPDIWTFRVATCVNVSAVYFVMPYFFAAGSVQEPSGRGAAYVASAFMVTGAVSPYLGGVLLDTVGTAVIGVCVVATSIISWLMFAYVDRRTETRATLTTLA